MGISLGQARRRSGRQICASALIAHIGLRLARSYATLWVHTFVRGGAEDRMNGTRIGSPSGGFGAGAPRLAWSDT
jgi:hypothetical protein